jgi:UDP-3-O-[3-hydroxymyristoyl] N-acetylglucosamine deacetylase
MLAHTMTALQMDHSLSTTHTLAPFSASAQHQVSLYQQTLLSSVKCQGIGVHSGNIVNMMIKPAPVNTGYLFIRTDLPQGDNGIENQIKALWSTVLDTSMSTKIGNDYGVTVSTIEHIIAALAGLQIHNAVIELNGPEVPIMDGSSVDFVELLMAVGVKKQRSRIKTIRVLKPIQVSHGLTTAFLLPSDEPRITMEFNFNDRFGETTHYSYYPDTDDFASTLAQARTFGFYEDAEKLRALGLAKGASFENTIVIGESGIMNEGGLRYEDEFIRHKVLDAIGDLALSGARLLAHFDGTNSGHTLNNKILRALFNDPAAWVLEETNENSFFHIG